MDALDFTREQLAQYILTTAKESSISKIKKIVLSEKKKKEIVAYTIKREPVTKEQYVSRNEQAVSEYKKGAFMTKGQVIDRYKVSSK